MNLHTTFQGAYAGLISGLVIALWLGIAPIIYTPYSPTKPISIEGCPLKNLTGSDMTIGPTLGYTMTTPAEPRPEDK